MNKNKSAITLVEIIIALSVLAILWIIWFLSFWTYLVTVRDSTRLVEIENIESSFWTYVLRSGHYPEPTNWKNITYSWSIVWIQWTFWNSVSDKIWYSRGVVDPLTKSEYTYSIKNTRREYSIAWVFEERPGLVYNNIIKSTANAETLWKKTWVALVWWNYNWEIISTLLNWVTNILAIPSIISSDLTSLDLQNIINNKKFVYNDYNTLPASYSWTVYKLDSGINFSANNLVVFSWSISDLNRSYNQIIFLKNLYSAYSWSILTKTLSSNKVDVVDLFSPEPSLKITTQACDVINFKLKYFVECWWVDFITFFVVNVLHIDIANLPWSKITAVFQDASWNFVFGTNWWLALYDGTTWLTYTTQNSSLIHNTITSVVQDNSWNYWIWTVNWISKLTIGNFANKADDIWVTYGKSQLVGTHIQYIYTDTNWIIWIWTNVWVTSYNWNTWKDYTSKSAWLSSNEITVIYNDSIWNVWFWTNSKWVDKYKVSNWAITNYTTTNLPDKDISYIFEDSTHKMWIWTHQWIWVTSNYWTTWTKYTKANTSWWVMGDIIGYLFEDSAWNIWVWTNTWLSKFNWSTWIKYSKTISPNAPKYLLWNNIFLINEDWNGNIIIFSEWWLDTIDTSWNIIT